MSYNDGTSNGLNDVIDRLKLTALKAGDPCYEKNTCQGTDMRWPMLLLILLTTFASCERSTSTSTAAQIDKAANKEVVDSIDAALARPVTGRGPEFSLPETTVTLLQGHAVVAKEILEDRIKSSNANIRFNAYDCIAAISSVPEVHQWATETVGHAMQTEGVAVQEYLTRISNRGMGPQRHESFSPTTAATTEKAAK
jgi:hypothetical protein